MEMPLISVIVPVYKVEKYLNQCVESIVNQTYRNLEIILVDDGSPDNCPAMCDAWAAKDSRIKVIHKENGGLSDARNAGLDIAAGAYIAFVDSDDWIAPDFLELLYEALKAKNADIAECGVAYVDEGGNVLRNRATANLSEMDKIEALRRLVLEDGIYQTVWNKLYRREVIDGIQFEKGRHHEDDFWTYQVFDRADRLATVNRLLYNYLQRDGSIMGGGYTLKRLDGLEARFQRMQYLQKYEELACLTQQQLVFECQWHLQCVLRYLQGDEKKQATGEILDKLSRTPKVRQRDLRVNVKNRVRYGMFRAVPVLTARLFNVAKMGI